MSDINIDSLRIEAKTNIKDAISDIESLKQSLTGLGDGKSGLDRYSSSVTGLTQRLTHLTRITDKSGIAAVEKSIRELAEEAIKLNNLQLDEKKGSIFSESTWNDALKNVESAMENVKNTIAQKMREVKPLEGVEKDFDNYIRKAGKVKIPIGVKNDLKVDKEFSNLRSVLGKNFSTTNDGVDFVKFVEDMNNAIHTTFDTTQNATDLFKEVVNHLKDIRKEATLTAQDVIKNGLLPVKEIEAELSKFTAKDIPNLNEKYNLNESELYADKTEKSEESSANAVKEVITAVNQKTKAFEREQQTVADVVKLEMKELINLRTTIESVTKAVSARSGLTQAFEDLSNSGLKDLASLKDIDFSGLARLRKENLKALTELNSTGLTDSEKAIINDAAEKAVAPESVPWLEDYQSLLQKARDEAHQFFGEFYVPESVEELQGEFEAISTEIVRLKQNIQEALSTLDTDYVPQLVDDLSQALAYFYDLTNAASQKGITLTPPKSEWKEYSQTDFPEGLRDNGLSEEMGNTARETSNASDRIEEYNEDLKNVIRTEQSFKEALEAASKEPSIFKDMPEDVNRFNQDIQKLPFSLSQLKSNISDLTGIMGGFAGKAISVANIIGKIGSMAVNTSKKIGSLAKGFAKISWETLNFGSNKNALSGLKNPLNQSSASLGDFNKKLKHGITTVLRYGFGIRSLYVLFNKLRSGIQDGFNNLVIYSDKANQSLSLLQADLSYVGNSAAAAFEPILNVVAPIIDQIVDYMVAGINSVGAFIAAITGQSTYTVAVKNIKSYRDSLSGAASAGDAASDATDKVKDSAAELKRELMGFDEIEKFSEDLNDAANSGAGGGGNGSGNSGGTEDPILFTKKDIPGAVSNFADLVKDAWAKSDFTEIGNIVGTKLRDALDSIDWEPIKAQANKIARVTGTFINGFFETEGLDVSIGKTLGEAVNTAVGAINTFIDTTHWDSLGEFMSGGLRSAIATIDWDGLGKALNARYTALWGFIDGFVVDMSQISFTGTTGWQEAGNALASTINSIFADRDYTATGKTISEAINGIASTLQTAINDINFKQISANFANGINSVFYGVDWEAIGQTLADGVNTASSSLLTFSIAVDWKKIGNDLASTANKFLAETDFSQAGAALGEAFKGALSAINEFAATFNWRSLGIDINNFIKGINWGGILKTAANTVANTFFGLFETAWAAVFGGSDTKYTAIADNLNKAISKLKIEWPEIEEEELKKFDNVSTIVDRFLELNEKLKKNGSLSEVDMSLFKTYYEQIVEYAPQAAELIGGVGKAYEGTDEALKNLIQSQKNLAIQEGFKQAMEGAAKVYSDAALSLDGAVTELVNSIAANQKLVYDAWSHDKPGTWDQFQTDLANLFQKMRDGSLDIDHLTESESRMITALIRADDPFSKQTQNVIDLIGAKNEAEETLDRISAASQRYGESAETAATNTGKLVAELGKIKVPGIWKDSDTLAKNLFESITESLKDPKNLLKFGDDLKLKVDLTAGSLDTSKLSKDQKTVGGVSAGIVSAKNQIPEALRKLDFTGAITKKTDEIKDRKINNLEGSVSKVTQTGGLTLNNLGGWISYIGSRVQNLTLDNVGAWINYIGSQNDNMTLKNIGAWVSYIGSQTNGMTLKDIGAWISNIGSQVEGMTLKDIGAWINYIGSQNNGMTLSNIGAWISNIAAQTGGLALSGIGAWISYIAQTGGLSLSGILGYVNQVQKQSGFSLVLSGITGLISSITAAFKAEGGAYYGGKWHNIPQFSDGGIITPKFMANFETVPKFAGGTLNAGSMFIAGEAGPELVGHVGGRTEVLNQSQLASIMENAIASGMARAGNSGNVTVNVVLQGDTGKIFEVVKAENNRRVMQTGQAQFLV